MLRDDIHGIADVKDIFEMVSLVLEQKAVCQMDPDQEEGEDLPEDQAEEDSMLITAASDVVASLATTLGAQFTEPFQTFFPLITKYYVSNCAGARNVLGILC